MIIIKPRPKKQNYFSRKCTISR